MEADGEDGNMSSVALPGFIDILSTVIIMFVFFVTVIAVMLYVHILKFKSELAAESKASISQEVQKILDDMEDGQIDLQEMKDVLSLQRENYRLQEQIKEMSSELSQIRAQYASSSSLQKMLEDSTEKSITIFFDVNAISIGTETETKFVNFLEKTMQTKPSEAKIYITAPLNPSAPTGVKAKQFGLARMLNARNVLLKSKIPQNNIVVQFADDPPVEGSYNWVKVRIE